MVAKCSRLSLPPGRTRTIAVLPVAAAGPALQKPGSADAGLARHVANREFEMDDRLAIAPRLQRDRCQIVADHRFLGVKSFAGRRMLLATGLHMTNVCITLMSGGSQLKDCVKDRWVCKTTLTARTAQLADLATMDEIWGGRHIAKPMKAITIHTEGSPVCSGGPPRRRSTDQEEGPRAQHGGSEEDAQFARSGIRPDKLPGDQSE